MSKLNYNPDVLSCIANLSSDEVFTPPSLVNNMLDLLPSDIWKDQDAKFLDPATKSGVFLREIAKRLLVGLETKIPDLQTRVNHIFTKQVFGIATTELTSLLARRSIYCSKTANGKYSVCKFDDVSGNIIYDNISHSFKNGKCSFCGANQESYDRGEGLETHAYQFIHQSFEKFKDMKFDVIIGNPPYQLDTGGPSRQAKPIYNLFVEQAKKLNPRYLSMIIPSRWFAGGMGLDDFRKNMLQDRQLVKIVDFFESKDCFSGVDIAGGVCYFLWQKDANSDCEVINHVSGKVYKSYRQLDEFDTFIRLSPSVAILRKIKLSNEEKFTKTISPMMPFGLPTNERPSDKGDLKLLSSAGTGKIELSKITAGHKLIDKWKVITSKASYDHAGQPDKNGMRRILSRTEILPPNTVCTASYIILGCFDNESEAESCLAYAKTKFARFLVSLLSFSQDITRERFSHVPLQDFTQTWTDEKLYKKYGLDEEEIAFIESMIRPME
jgi:site-specific DNA-methyltransferase (adenine-specific)